MYRFLRSLALDESGQGLTEYALLLSTIVVVVAVATQMWNGAVTTLVTSLGDYLTDFLPG